MEEKKLMLTFMKRWSLVTFIAIALFWGIWFIVKGQVPTVSVFGFKISRWWDVLIGPIWSCMLIYFYTREESDISEQKEKYLAGLFCVMIFLFLFFGIGTVLVPVIQKDTYPIWSSVFSVLFVIMSTIIFENYSNLFFLNLIIVVLALMFGIVYGIIVSISVYIIVLATVILEKLTINLKKVALKLMNWFTLKV